VECTTVVEFLSYVSFAFYSVLCSSGSCSIIPCPVLGVCSDVSSSDIVLKSEINQYVVLCILYVEV
jgi:hypothetical protein